MEDLRTELCAVENYGHRNRRYIVGLAVSIGLDVALSIVVIIVALVVSSTNDIAHQNREAQKASCLSGNDTRAASVQLWSYVLDTAERNNPANRAQIEDFRTYMKKAYAPRDCNQTGS
jgi:hypothetical protein